MQVPKIGYVWKDNLVEADLVEWPAISTDAAAVVAATPVLKFASQLAFCSCLDGTNDDDDENNKFILKSVASS